MIRITAIAFLMFLGLLSCNKGGYVEYKPHYLESNGENRYYGEPKLDSIKLANTIQVLTYYREDFKIKNGNVVLIPKDLSKDWELLYNYTNKASNIDWLKTHKTQ